MKTRFSFVSNSSSCSFIIALQTNKDVEEFKKLANALLKQNVNMTVSYSLDAASTYDYTDVLREDNAHILDPECFVLCDSGEDHDIMFEKRYNDMCEIFDNSGYAFKTYEDPNAHMTRGIKI